MANYYNINRSIETYELRLIDPNDGQLKNIFDISNIGGSSGGYTDLQIDTFLNNKLNVNNPDATGTVRIAPSGGGKLIINSTTTPASESLYVAGLSTFTGTVKVPLLQASSNIQSTQKVKSDTYDTNTNTDMKIQRKHNRLHCFRK